MYALRIARWTLTLLCLSLVHGEFSEIPKLIITEEPVGGSVVQGNRFDFTCRATTSTDLSITYSWRRITDLNSLDPTYEDLSTVNTGSEGVYIEYSAQDSAFYFCVVQSGDFVTSSSGAYLEVGYLDDFASDAGPSDQDYTDARLSVELQCTVPDSNPYPTVTWYKQGVEFTAENAIMSRDSQGRPSNLVVFDLSVDDSGEYHCGVSNEITGTQYETASAYIRIDVDATTTGTWDPVGVVPNYALQGTEGTTITLYAGVASRPKADYIWSIDGTTIASGDRYSFEDYDRSLVISELSASDQGTYVVTYEQGGVSKGTINIQLEVIEAVKAEGDVYDYATVEGEDLALDCGCTGSPPDWVQYSTDSPATQWLKNDVLLTNGSDTEVYVTVNGKNTGKALVKSVEDGDSGTYACTCFNQAEFLTFTKNVYVTDEMVAMTVASEAEGWGLVGDTVSISCEAEGVPRPNIDWYTGGSKVVEGIFPRSGPGFTIRYKRSMFKTVAHLILEDAEHEDSGEFECLAYHTVQGVRYNVTSTSDLTIAYPTSSRIQCLNATVEEGASATIVCGVSGVPMPTVTYTKLNQTDGSLIELGEDFGYITNTSYYVIHAVSLEDAGQYRGYATNKETGGFLARFDVMTLTVTESSSQMSMNSIIGLSVLVAFLLLGGLVCLILVGRWRRETAFNAEVERLIAEREEEIVELQQRLQLRSMENVAPVLGNPLHQLTEARRQMPSFYAANIAALAAAPATKALPPSMRARKRRGTGSVISNPSAGGLSEVEVTSARDQL